MEKLLIKTNRLQIRNLSPTDLDDFYAYRSDPEVIKYQSFDTMTVAQSRHFIQGQKNKLFGQPGEWIQLGIEEISLQKLIGDCALKIDLYDSRMAEIGITISQLHQRQGYAKETISGILNFIFGTKKMHRVTATVDAENTASINLMNSIGFRREAHYVENIFFNGKWGSEVLFAMLHREWKNIY